MPEPIPAQMMVRPDGLVVSTVRGAAIPPASMVPMDQAKAVLMRFSAAYGPLFLTAVYPDGRQLAAILTPAGMQPYTPPAPAPQPAPAYAYQQPVPQPGAYAHPQPAPAQIDPLEDLARSVTALPPIRRKSTGATEPSYRAPGMEHLNEALKGTDPGAPDVFAGSGQAGAPHLHAGAQEPGTPGNWVTPDEIPDVNVEEDVRQALARQKAAAEKPGPSRAIPRIPSKALKSAAVVGTIFSIVAGLMIAKPWLHDEPAERPDRTVFEQLENGELQGG